MGDCEDHAGADKASARPATTLPVFEPIDGVPQDPQDRESAKGREPVVEHIHPVSHSVK